MFHTYHYVTILWPRHYLIQCPSKGPWGHFAHKKRLKRPALRSIPGIVKGDLSPLVPENQVEYQANHSGRGSNTGGNLLTGWGRRGALFKRLESRHEQQSDCGEEGPMKRELGNYKYKDAVKGTHLIRPRPSKEPEWIQWSQEVVWAEQTEIGRAQCPLSHLPPQGLCRSWHSVWVWLQGVGGWGSPLKGLSEGRTMIWFYILNHSGAVWEGRLSWERTEARRPLQSDCSRLLEPQEGPWTREVSSSRMSPVCIWLDFLLCVPMFLLTVSLLYDYLSVCLTSPRLQVRYWPLD